MKKQKEFSNLLFSHNNFVLALGVCPGHKSFQSIIIPKVFLGGLTRDHNYSSFSSKWQARPCKHPLFTL